MVCCRHQEKEPRGFQQKGWLGFQRFVFVNARCARAADTCTSMVEEYHLSTDLYVRCTVRVVDTSTTAPGLLIYSLLHLDGTTSAEMCQSC